MNEGEREREDKLIRGTKLQGTICTRVKHLDNFRCNPNVCSGQRTWPRYLLTCETTNAIIEAKGKKIKYKYKGCIKPGRISTTSREIIKVVLAMAFERSPSAYLGENTDNKRTYVRT